MNALRLRRCPGNLLALLVAALVLLATPGAVIRGLGTDAAPWPSIAGTTAPPSGRRTAGRTGLFRRMPPTSGASPPTSSEYSRALDLLDDAVLSDDLPFRRSCQRDRRTTIGRARRGDFERGGSLDGSLASDALLQAADAFKSIGLEADARRCLDRARRIGGSSTGSGRVAGFTIQFGAFGSRENATKCARAVDSASRAAGLGSPQILRQDGLYKVQVGSYANLAIAGRALDGIRQTPEVLPTIVEIGN